MQKKEETITISFDQKKFRDFIKAYNQAKEEGKEVFIFEGAEVLLKYAYYLIEHLANEFARAGIKIKK